jgi:hypothetical protein
MSRQIVFTRPVKAAVLGFLSLAGVLMAIAAAERIGVIEATVSRRAIGLVVGVMSVVIGNFLPKTRPLNVPGGNHAKATAAERLAGWILVLAGIAYIALFAFAPLEQARPISSIIGISAILMIAANWAWLARGAFSRSQQTDQETAALREQGAEKRRLIAFLLFAFFWIFATACAAFLFEDKRWVKGLGLWTTLGFPLFYAGLTAVLDFKRTPR